MPERILRLADVRERTGLGRTTIMRLEARGEFPRRRRVADAAVGWIESEIDEWLRSRPVVGGADAGAAEVTDAAEG